MTHATLNTLFEQMETERTALLARLQVYDDALLNKKPSPEAWSAIEVLHHLIMAEEASLTYLQKKTQNLNSANKAGIREKLRSLLLHISFSIPIKFKAPGITAPSVHYTTLKETKAKWDTIRKGLKEVWMKMPADKLDGNWFKHTLAGKLSLDQMLRFMSIHVSRHEQQVWRTIKTVS
jgi:hypothetical protein